MKIIKTAGWMVFLLALVFVAPPTANHFFAGDTRLMEVVVYDSGETHEHQTGAGTVSELFLELGITLNTHDRTNYPADAPVWDGMKVIIFREVAFGIRIDRSPINLQHVLPGATVGQILVQQQFEHGLTLLYGGDLARYIENGEVLAFTTWDSRFYTEHELIPYEIIENRTGAVREGRSHVRQAGEKGEHEITSAVVIIGGQESNREIITSNIVAHPVAKIIDIGTAPLGALTDVTAPDFHYVRHLRMEATAYTAGFSCTGKHPWDPWYRITASGMRVTHGVVAVDRTVIPLGTRLYVENYGFAIAADVGGAIRGYKIDLFMECIQAARRFGRRHINVWILD